MDFALGELGLLPDTLWDLTWDEYQRAVKGYQVRQDREWERTRMLCVQVVNMLSEKPVKLQEYMWLSTDEVPEEAPEKETMEEFWARMQAANFFRPAAE